MFTEKDVTCPACFARVGEPCTQPTDSSRRNVSWFHASRKAEASERELERKAKLDAITGKVPDEE